MIHEVTVKDIREDCVRVEIKSGNRAIEYINIEGLPPAGARREAMVSAMVKTHIVDRAYRRKRVQSRAWAGELTECLQEPAKRSASPPPLAELIISCFASEH